MDAVDIMFRLAGAFYFLAGFLAMRSVLMDAFLDRALAMITLKPVPAVEKVQRFLLLRPSSVSGRVVPHSHC